jgi:REP element-mobilizing transposase RayT
MRTARAFPSEGSQAGFFHCLSRVVDRRFILGDPEKETFRKILRACETFYGLKVLTYCIMSNHFHVLVEVPEPQELTDDEVLRRIAALYPPKFTKALRQDLEAFRQAGLEERTQGITGTGN